MKKVSIIIPCYNSSSTIERTLNSVKEQCYKNIEIIIVNDGSTDNTKEKLEYLNSINKGFIKVFNQTNKGQSAARNFGAKKATGHYFLFLDADDIIEKSYIQECVEVFLKNPKVKIVYSKAVFFGSKKGEWYLPEFNMKDFLLENCIYVSAMHKADDFKNVNGYDEELTFYEDWDLWIKIITSNEEVYRINKSLFKYYKHNIKSSITDKGYSNIDMLSKNRLAIFLKNINKYNDNGVSFFELSQRAKNYEKIHKKYYNVWYRKLFYKLKRANLIYL